VKGEGSGEGEEAMDTVEKRVEEGEAETSPTAGGGCGEVSTAKSSMCVEDEEVGLCRRLD
jgi:hypothetical protein